MVKRVIVVAKKIVLSAFTLYGYNLIAVNFNMIIPVNAINVGLMSFFGMPALLTLILFRVFIL